VLGILPPQGIILAPFPNSGPTLHAEASNLGCMQGICWARSSAEGTDRRSSAHEMWNWVFTNVMVELGPLQNSVCVRKQHFSAKRSAFTTKKRADFSLGVLFGSFPGPSCWPSILVAFTRHLQTLNDSLKTVLVFCRHCSACAAQDAAENKQERLPLEERRSVCSCARIA
jgi:hypothetical protein